MTERDPLIDALRSLALAVVVIGHFLMSGVWWVGDDLTVVNVLKLDGAQWTHWLTWVLQPMPLLFAVGAWANASSWARIASDPDAQKGWLTSRVRRLCVPTTTFVVALTVLVVVVHPLAPDLVHEISRRLAMPLWFLAVYLPLTAATPTMVRLATRHGWRALAALGLVIVLVDVVQAQRGLDWVGWLNLPLVWFATAQVGATAALRASPRRRVLARVALSSFGLLFVAVAADWYPVSMIGVGPRSNTTPPSVALALLAVAQLALVWYFRSDMRRVASREGLRRKVAVFGAAGMHVYLWHLSAVIALVGIQRLGMFDIEPLTASWWLTRPIVVAGLLAVVAAVAVPVARYDLGRLRASEAAPGHTRGLVAAGLGAAGCGAVTITGFGPGVVPMAGALSVAAAARIASARTAPRPDAPSAEADVH